MFNKIRRQLTLWYSLGILFSILILVVLFYASTQIVFYRQVDDTLNSHLIALTNDISYGARGAGCNCVSRESPFLEGILQIPGMPTAILDLNHKVIKSSVDWTQPNKALTDNDVIPGRYFNDRLAGQSYRFSMMPVISEGKYLGFVIMGHPIEAFLQTRTVLAEVMIVVFLFLIFPVLLLGRFLAEKALAKEKQFLGDMAHSLKTPLAVLQSQIESQNEKDRLMLLTQVKKISLAVSETLENTYSGANQTKEIIDLNDLLEELVEIGQHLGQKKKIKISKNLSSERIFVLGTKQHLTKALLSVLENAVNYGKINGKITVSLKKDGDRAITSIADNGLGISVEDLPHVFDRFYRGKNVVKTKGQGLGLSLAKNILEELGCKISLESKKNVGTKVTIELPIVRTV